MPNPTRRSMLSQLTGAPLSQPCAVEWDAMSGGDRVRHCAACDREVWNLSAMSAREAEVRLLNAPSLPCINYRLDAEGRLVTREAPRAPARNFGLGAAAFVATTLIAPGHGTLGGSLAGATDKQPPAPTDAAGDGAPGNKDKPGNQDKPDKADKQDKKAKRDKTRKLGRDEDCPVAAPSAPGAAALDPSPPQLGGAPPLMREEPPAGAVLLKSAQPRDVEIDGVTFSAPTTIRLPLGKHEALIKDGAKTRKRAFVVKKVGLVVVDLDR